MSVTKTGTVARLTVRVTPRGGRDAIDRAGDDGVLRVRVAAAPADGRANAAVLRIVARALGVPHTRLRIVSGATSRTKVLEVDGIAPEELGRRVEAVTSDGTDTR